MTTKASGKLTFHDRLSRLSPGEAGRLLGENGSQLIHRGGRNFGEMLGAVFSFLGELVLQDRTAAPSPEVIQNVRSRLDQCVESDDQGRPRLSLTLPNREALDNLAQTLAKLLVAGGS